MFQWIGDDQKEQLVEEEAFPLQNVEEPMRAVIFRQMKMDTLMKLAFESLAAARDIAKAHISPKTMHITVGDRIERKIEFHLDGFSCIVGSRKALPGVKEDFAFFSAKTISGESLEEVTTQDNRMFFVVPQEEDLLGAVKTFYTHLCFVFEEPLTTNLSVMGEFAYLYPVISTVRNIARVDQLELYGNWMAEEEQTGLFNDIMERTTYNYLALYGTPPVESKPVRIVADRVYFSISHRFWVDKNKWSRVDAKNIVMRSQEPQHPALAVLFISALKCWAKGTRFNSLENMKIIHMNPSHIRTVMANLPLTDWIGSRRPGYYCGYKTVDNKKVFSVFHDLREAKDVQSPNGLGTIIELERSLMFLKWTPEVVQELRNAPGLILEKKEELSKELQAYNKRIDDLEEFIRLKGFQEEQLRERKASIRAELILLHREQENDEQPDSMIREVRLMRESTRVEEDLSHFYQLASDKEHRDKLMNEIQKCDGYLKLMEDHPF